MEEATGLLTPSVQIECAIDEGMCNIGRAIFGENLSFMVSYTLSELVSNGVQMAQAKASVVTAFGRTLSITADVPIRYPDAASGSYRIDEIPYAVEGDDWANSFTYEAWCENNPGLGAAVIVRAVRKQDGMERWLVAESMENEVLFRGPYESLFPWAKKVVAEKWSHLPHVCIDTEKRAMDYIRFQSRGTQ